MNPPPEFTPKENFQASLYRNPEALFRRALLRTLSYVIPSLALMAAWFITKDPAYAIVGYGILLYQTFYRLVLTRRGAQTTGNIIKKYEAKQEGPKPPPAA